MTKKKVPPDQAPIEPNKGSALPSKGKQEKDQAPNQIEALIESRRQKDKILILKKKTSDKGNQRRTIRTAFWRSDRIKSAQQNKHQEEIDKG